MPSEKEITALCVALAVIILAFSVYYLIPTDTMEMDMSVTISNHIGFDVNTSAITFGTLMPDSFASRDVTVLNPDNYGKIAHFTAEGNITRLVTLPPDTPITANGNLTVNIRASAPSDAEKGYYEGKLIISLRRAP
jgi:hypothetical protein